MLSDGVQGRLIDISISPGPCEGEGDTKVHIRSDNRIWEFSEYVLRHSAIVGLESPSRVGHGTCMHGAVKLFKNLKNFLKFPFLAIKL